MGTGNILDKEKTKDLIKIKENIYFLAHIKNGLQGKLSNDSICSLIWQLDELIQQGREVIKIKPVNGTLNKMESYNTRSIKTPDQKELKKLQEEFENKV